MGKKLAPLRDIFSKKGSQSEEGASKDVKGSGAGGDGAAGSKRSNADSSLASKKKKPSKVDDEDDIDWEKLENEQNDDAEQSDDDDDEDGSEDGDGIRLDGNLEHVVEDYTFEFNDMRDEYSEGICTMLRKFIANPTEAYNVATAITSQSECFVLTLMATIKQQTHRSCFLCTHSDCGNRREQRGRPGLVCLRHRLAGEEN
jgi:hypothetical protein